MDKELKSLYTAWRNIKQRCYNPKRPGFELYGGRGIKVCDRWQGADGFKNFYEDLGLRPSPSYSIDRIDNDGNYEPDNVKWSTKAEQASNRRLRVNGLRGGRIAGRPVKIQKSNKSGYRGVHFHAKAGRWAAQKYVDGKQIWLGYFDTAELANKAVVDYT